FIYPLSSRLTLIVNIGIILLKLVSLRISSTYQPSPVQETTQKITRSRRFYPPVAASNRAFVGM
ncbi:hypothetical protein, partial [Alistipes putredinis]